MLPIDLGKALKVRRSGNGYIAHCPAHDDGTPSLAIDTSEDGKLLFYCHAGCSQQEVLDALRSILGHGLCRSSGSTGTFAPKLRAGNPNSAKALRIWNETVPGKGTLVESYLTFRGIITEILECLRFHPGLWCNEIGGFLPAMVALVTDCSGTGVAVHRTYLAPDGRGKAKVLEPKMTLGPCKGNAIHLAPPLSGVLMVGEGIETCLSVMQATHLPAWSGISSSFLGAVQLPPEVREIIALVDGDASGERAMRKLAARYTKQGRIVRIARAPWGQDFNDVLMQELNTARGNK